MIKPSTYLVETNLGYNIGATVFYPLSSNGKSLVISSATGVLQRYYSKLAAHFSTIGYTVYTFDYSGIGASNLTPLKRNNVDLKSWGENDQASMIAFAKTRQPSHKIILMTHSIGGQILPFNKNLDQVDLIITVASQSGYWKHWKGFERLKMQIFWNVFIPALTPIFGYFPAKTMGLFENLPKQMTYQWRRWAQHENYMLSEFDSDSLAFSKYDNPMLVLSFPRDEYAPKTAVDWLALQFSNAPIDRSHIIPKDLAIPNVGHFGFFRETFKESLWKMTEEWIENNL
ncbi:alpha/beta fold hydrolase [Winogradskyella sp. 3972H.M.0a.05]|uniref:alpha/beta hydrolase family protein n=1 Tax=Winogradskyella sp. 3972H.M.0a.05 TaxID=2950277 RepID=UPI00339903A0